MSSRLSVRHGLAAGLVVLGLSACANVVGLTALHDGICDPGSTQECPYSGPMGTQNVGTCKAGVQTCNSDGQGWGACYGEVLPTAQLDCKASVDATCGTISRDECCTPPSSATCYDGKAGTEGVGNCKGGTKTCSETYGSYGPCMSEVTPAAKDDCYTLGDEDCDGNACSDPVWDLVFNDSNGEAVTGVAIDSQGDVYIAGTFNYYLGVDGQMFPDANPSTGDSQFYLVKLSHQAPHHMLWHKLLGVDMNDGGVMRVAIDKDDNVILAGDLRTTIDFGKGPLTTSGGSAYLAKYDSQGNCLWAELIGGTSSSTANASGIALAVDSTGGILLGGSWYGGTLDLGATMLTATKNGAGYGFVAGFGPDGKNTWGVSLSDGSATPPANSYVSVSAVAVSPTDPTAIYVAGTFNSKLQLGSNSYLCVGVSDIFLAQLDGAGTAGWNAAWGSSQLDALTSLAVSAAGNVAVAGTYGGKITVGTTTLTPMAGASDGFAAVFDGTGAPLWAKGFGGASKATSAFVAFDKAGNCFLTGAGTGDVDLGAGVLTNTGVTNVFLGKLDDKGAVLWNKLFGSAQAGLLGGGLALDPSTGNVAIAGQLGGTGSISFGLSPITGNYNAYFAEFQY